MFAPASAQTAALRIYQKNKHSKPDSQLPSKTPGPKVSDSYADAPPPGPKVNDSYADASPQAPKFATVTRMRAPIALFLVNVQEAEKGIAPQGWRTSAKAGKGTPATAPQIRDGYADAAPQAQKLTTITQMREPAPKIWRQLRGCEHRQLRRCEHRGHKFCDRAHACGKHVCMRKRMQH